MNEVSFASKVWGADDTSDAPGDAPWAGMPDAAEFQQLLQAAAPKAETAAPTVGSIIDAVAHSLHEHNQNLGKAIKRAGKSADPVEMLAVSKHLSESYLSHSLAVKVIGKTTQALENLSRLQ